MMWLVLGTSFLLCLLLSGFFAGSETGLYCLSKLRLHLGVQRGDRAARRLARLVDDEHGALSATLIGNNVVNYLLTAIATYALVELWHVSELDAEVYAVATLTPLVFVFGEIVPKNLFRLHADQWMLHGSALLSVVFRICRITGAAWLLGRVSRLVGRLVGVPPGAAATIRPKQRVAALLQEALTGRSSYSGDQTDLVERACSLWDTPLHVVMTPLNRVVTISTSATRKELLRVAAKTTLSSIPAYEQDRRRVVGLVPIDALIQSDDWETVGDRLGPVLTAGAHQTVASTIAEMRSAGLYVAIVTDRGGRMLGLVSLRGLLARSVA